MNGGGAASAADAKRARKMARDRMKRLSTKTRNKRQPPERWGRQKKEISPVDMEEESEKDDSDELEEEDYDAMDVDGSGKEQPDDDSDDSGGDDDDMEF